MLRFYFTLHIIGVIYLSSFLPGNTYAAEESASKWYKGQTHTHTMWSGKYGDPNWNGAQCLPEIAAWWYKSHGYNFVAFTDYSYTTSGKEVLWQGEKWSKPLSFYSWYDIRRCVDDAEKLFGPGWNVVKGSGDQLQVKLKTFDEVSAKLNEPDRFLLIPGVELGCPGILLSSNPPKEAQIHINAINVGEVTVPRRGSTVAETIKTNLKMLDQQAKRLDRTIIATLNHPNAYWHNMSYSVSAEDMAEAANLRFVEIMNGGPVNAHYGDETHPGVEKLWDIANTMRLNMKRHVIYGVASDDTHDYPPYTKPSPKGIPPGRGFIMVRAKSLSAETILKAMLAGDFYASTGLLLNKLEYDHASRTLSIEVAAEKGVNYRIDFIGTMQGVKAAKNANGKYSDEIGKVLKSVDGSTGSYTLTGQELYVRAFVWSDRQMDCPPYEGVQNQCAWTQPVVP